MSAISLALLLAASASSAPPQAPGFTLPVLLQAPAGAPKTLAGLKDKVVYLEFWATWCAPCVAGFPRTNRLIEKLSGQPVVFLAVTDEDPAMIAAWLKTHHTKAWVGVDPTKATLEAYKNRHRPDGYLIGKDGALLARVSPESLEEKDLRDALAGRFAARPAPFKDVHRGGAGPEGEPLYEVSIRPASGEWALSSGAGELAGTGLPFKDAVAEIWDVPRGLVVVEKPPVEAFDFRLKTAPERFESGRERLKEAVAAAFGLTLKPEKRMTDVLLLELLPGSAPPAAAAPGGKRGLMAYGPGRLLGTASAGAFARALYNAADLPVVDATGLKDEFALDLEWKRGDAAERDKALASAGLRLARARRELDFYVAAPASAPQ